MALTTNIPPQAYTRDTLVKAIEWIQSQSPAVRERATSADLVVSHYLQARRRAAFESDAPVSTEVFKSDLKHLAEDLKQFESPTSPHTQVPNRSPSFELPQELQVQPASWQKPAPPPPAAPMVEEVHTHVAPPASAAPAHPAPPVARPAAPQPSHWPMDARTLAAAREVQHRLNLSSEVEALRLLVTLGAERARALFP